MKRAFLLILPLVFLHLSTRQSLALVTPPIFSCQSPVGATIADFNQGTHGIAGDSATYTGSDRVYQVDSNHVVQCFCPSDSNNGIQSNWVKLTDSSEETINYYQKLGWIYVPSGLAWGLDDSPYIVANQSYSCHGDAGGYTPGDSGSSSSNSNSGSSSNSNSGSNSNVIGDLGAYHPVGDILGASTLAATGNDRMILLYAFLGIAFGLTAYRLAKE